MIEKYLKLLKQLKWRDMNGSIENASELNLKLANLIFSDLFNAKTTKLAIILINEIDKFTD